MMMITPPLRPGMVPPFHELGPDVFEDLCRELVQEEDTRAERYGTPGQSQFGVDLLIHYQDGSLARGSKSPACIIISSIAVAIPSERAS